MTRNEEGPEQQVSQKSPEFTPAYTPPPQFKLIDTPPLLQEVLPDNRELWLVRLQDNQLGTDDFKEKPVTLALKSSDGSLGSFESSKGVKFEFLDLRNVNGVQPFAFLPKGDSSLEVCRISRQMGIVRSLDPIVLSSPYPKADQDVSSLADGKSKVRQSTQGTPIPLKHKESHSGSASLSAGIGGLSTVESLQEEESTGKLWKSPKKSKKEHQSADLDVSPLRSSQKDGEVRKEHKSSDKKSRKHKKVKADQNE